MTRKRRAGLTLMEVLVSLAILAFGLLAIMTLFPLSAIQMGRAVRHDRGYQAARNADGLFRSYWKADIAERNGAGDPPLFNALDDPDGTGPMPAARPNEWSYPVAVDPWGHAARLAPARDWFGDAAGTRVPRRTMTLMGSFAAANPQQVLSSVCLKDTMGYDDDMRPTPDREYRYNWMWVIQRPLNSNRYAAYMTVIVFDDRAHLFAPPGSEALFGARFEPGQTAVTVNHAANNPPEVKPGAWVMDATIVAANRPLIRHANPYEVVSVTPVSATQTILELQTPVKTPTDNNRAGYDGMLVVLRGACGAYTRSPLTSE
jgi:prepilin-type N-terminal cleavage/methylation domain-containing protein